MFNIISIICLVYVLIGLILAYKIVRFRDANYRKELREVCDEHNLTEAQGERLSRWMLYLHLSVCWLFWIIKIFIRVINKRKKRGE